MLKNNNIIAFQGAHGAYSDLACRKVFPDLTTLPCKTFEDTFAAIRDGRAALGMIPIENSIAGRVADIHYLLPKSGLFIINEHFQSINHFLLAIKGASIKTITHVHSHVHALSQCRNFINNLKIEPVIHADTAGAAKELSKKHSKTQSVIASDLAARLHGLEVLA